MVLVRVKVCALLFSEQLDYNIQRQQDNQDNIEVNVKGLICGILRICTVLNRSNGLFGVVRMWKAQGGPFGFF